MKQFLILLVLFAIVMIQCSDKVAGTNDETVSGTACLYMPGGKQVAVGANVTLYAAGDTSHIPRYITETDVNGNYQITQLSDGIYNILAGKDSLVAYQDSILVIRGKGTIKSDTLEKQGTLTGWVKVQPNDDPRNVIVNVTGTNIWTNVDKNGEFTLNKFATGEYTLALIPSPVQMPGYVNTFYSISAKGGINDTIKKPYEVTYTGIPVVTGLKGSYDTLKGVVKLTWNKPDYNKIKEFIIYRAEVIEGKESQYMRLAVTKDTIYSEKIEMDSLTLSGSYEYYVTIKNQSLVEGAMNEFVTVDVINSTTINKLFYSSEAIAYINVPCTLSVRPSLVYGTNIIYEWDIGNTGKLSIGDATNTITLTDITKDNNVCICKITGVNGRTCQDTIILHPEIMWERVGHFFDSTTDQIRTVENDNKLFAFTNNSTWSSSDGIAWKNLNSTSPSPTYIQVISFNNKLFTIDSSGVLWKSSDGVGWDTVTTDQIFTGVQWIFSFNSDLYVFNVAEDLGPPLFQLWKSTDLTHWNSIKNENFLSYISPIIQSDSLLLFTEGGLTSLTKTTDLIKYSSINISPEKQFDFMNSYGVLYQGTSLLLGEKNFFSIDGLTNWKLLSGTNPLISGKYLNSVIMFKDQLLIINSKGIFRSY